MSEKKCSNCRYRVDNGYCKYSGICVADSSIDGIQPSCWRPRTKAQELEDAMHLSELTKGRKLIGDMTHGYLYVDTDLVKGLINSMYGTSCFNDNMDAINYGAIYHEMNKKKESKNMNKIDYRRKRGLERIKKVIFNDPITVVFWNDGTKTIVKCGEDESYDPEKGLAMAISKYFFDNEGWYYDVFRKWLPIKEEDVKEEDNKKHMIKDAAERLKSHYEKVPKVYTAEELTELLKVTKDTIHRKCRQGKFPGAYKEGREWRIPYVED